MTTLPASVPWRTSLRGGWLRNFRMGEWLPEPVTPLCESWLLQRIERRFAAESRRDSGFGLPPPQHVLVNGWYYYSPLGTASSAAMLAGFLRRPCFLLSFATASRRPEILDRLLARRLLLRWRQQLLPRSRLLVELGERSVGSASEVQLIELVDRLADLAGEYFWSFAMVGGSAWKIEGALARFYRSHLVQQIGGSHQDLLCGLSAPMDAVPRQLVSSLDWIRPAFERPTDAETKETQEARHRRLDMRRRAAEDACRAALAARPSRLRRFEQLLGLAQRYAQVREEQAAWFTLGWPLMRRAVLRLGAALQERGVLEQAEAVFFLRHRELESAVRGAPRPSLARLTAVRRAEWERQRRLSPPLTLGRLPILVKWMLAGTVEAMRNTPAAETTKAGSTRILCGIPVSPGRATGPARIIRGPEEFERLQTGEVLIAPLTTPAWTPLFSRALAVVTDGGTITAHASLIAREYGIPGVAGAGTATRRLRDGQIVTVDGSAGLVEVLQ